MNFGRRKKVVTILGTEPEGLLAAHAAMSLKYPVILYGPHPTGSGQLEGWLGWVPAVLPGPPTVDIEIRLEGPMQKWMQKAYGDDMYQAPPLLPGTYRGWDLRAGLLDFLESNNLDIRPIDSIDEEPQGTKVVAIPTPEFCERRIHPEPHQFRARDRWILDSCLLSGLDNVELYDGQDRSWSCTKRVFGIGQTWWNGDCPQPPIDGVRKDVLPVSTTCDCWPDVIRVGKAAWSQFETPLLGYQRVLSALS